MTDATVVTDPPATPAAPPATPPATPPAEPAKTPPIAAGGEGATEPEKPPYWPEDWRKTFAKHIAPEDEKEQSRTLKQLARYVDPAAIFAKTRELEGKFSSGNLLKKPGKDAKPDEVQEFHKALGVPDEAAGYLEDFKPENGAVFGDADKPVAEAFLAEIHKAGAPPAVAHAALNWYLKNQEEQAAALDEMDDTFRRESEQALKEEFGAAFKRRTNGIASLFSTAPGGTNLENGSLYSRLMGGRMADGKIIGNDPDMVRFLVSLAHEVNPAASVVEDGDQSGKSISDEIAAIEKRMRDDRIGYFKDEAAQARYRELLDARHKMQARQLT